MSHRLASNQLITPPINSVKHLLHSNELPYVDKACSFGKAVFQSTATMRMCSKRLQMLCLSLEPPFRTTRCKLDAYGIQDQAVQNHAMFEQWLRFIHQALDLRIFCSAGLTTQLDSWVQLREAWRLHHVLVPHSRDRALFHHIGKSWTHGVTPTGIGTCIVKQNRPITANAHYTKLSSRFDKTNVMTMRSKTRSAAKGI